VFLELKRMPIGSDYRIPIATELQRCEIVIAPSNLPGPPRLMIAAAGSVIPMTSSLPSYEPLAAPRDLPIIPVLLDGRRCPTARSPTDLQPFAEETRSASTSNPSTVAHLIDELEEPATATNSPV